MKDIRKELKNDPEGEFFEILSNISNDKK
jgi:hypothetical protein